MFRKERKFKSRRHSPIVNTGRTCCKERQAVLTNAIAREGRARRRPFWFTVPKRALEFSFSRRGSITFWIKAIWGPIPKCDDWSVKLITRIQFRVKVTKFVRYMPPLSFSSLSLFLYLQNIVTVDFTCNRNV
jgi:hypothetical protein